jgi:hypothetical protein
MNAYEIQALYLLLPDGIKNSISAYSGFGRRRVRLVLSHSSQPKEMPSFFGREST